MQSDPRHVPLEACFNFRDIGGYETAAGARVRWGAVFRSGSLHRLTTADHETLRRLGVRTVVDLRSTKEVDRDGHFAASDEVAFHHLPLEDDTTDAAVKERDHGGTPLGEIYVEIAHLGCTGVAGVLRVVAEREHPVVIHCFAGKDRTGIIAALILSSIGVPDATIVADYQLSERSVAPSVAWAAQNDPEWAAMMAALPPRVLEAPAAAMAMFLDTLREHYGSIDAYLVHAGLDRDLLERLRARLLEP